MMEEKSNYGKKYPLTAMFLNKEYVEVDLIIVLLFMVSQNDWTRTIIHIEHIHIIAILENGLIGHLYHGMLLQRTDLLILV